MKAMLLHAHPRLSKALLYITLTMLVRCGGAGGHAVSAEQAAQEEADAADAYNAAKNSDDPDALIAIWNKHPKVPVAKRALKLGARRLLERAKAAAGKCDDPAAKGALAHVAPYTTDDPEVDSGYDEAQTVVGEARKRCQLKALDADLAKAEAAWDYVGAFARISNEKEVDGGELAKRREQVTAHHRAFLEQNFREMVAQKSIKEVLGDRREAFESNVDAESFPEELRPDIERHGKVYAGLRLLFEKLSSTTLFAPPIRHWVMGSGRTRLPQTPEEEGPALPHGLAFEVIAKGRADKTTLLAVTGAKEGDVLERIAAIKVLVVEQDARVFDTNSALPMPLVGARVFGPMAKGQTMLAVASVLSESGGNIVIQQLGGKRQRLTVKRSELRALWWKPGLEVRVLVDGKEKSGKVVEQPDGDSVKVQVDDSSEQLVPFANVRLPNSALPEPPTE